MERNWKGHVRKGHDPCGGASMLIAHRRAFDSRRDSVIRSTGFQLYLFTFYHSFFWWPLCLHQPLNKGVWWTHFPSLSRPFHGHTWGRNFRPTAWRSMAVIQHVVQSVLVLWAHMSDRDRCLVLIIVTKFTGEVTATSHMIYMYVCMYVCSMYVCMYTFSDLNQGPLAWKSGMLPLDYFFTWQHVVLNN